MPTYKMKAPDGATYTIDGPEGATDEQVRSQILKQHPTAGAPKAAPTPVDATGNFGENLAAGAGKAMTDMWLGGKQALNTVSGGLIGDKEALAKEAAEKAKLDAALMRTGGGNVGSAAVDIGSTFLPMGILAKAGTAAKILPKLLPAVTAAAGTGVAQNVLSPDENYSLGEKAATGAGMGLLGEGAGRIAGRVLKPMQGMVPEAVKQRIAQLPDQASLLAENISSSPAVRAATNALAQIPGFGAGIVKAREKNLGEITKLATGAAGHEVEALTPEATAALHNRVANQANAFRAGPDLPVPGMPAALDAAKQEADIATRLFGTNKPARQIESAKSAITPNVPGAQQPTSIMQTIQQNAAQQPGPRLANTLEAAAGGTPGAGNLSTLPGFPVKTPTIPSDVAMDVRRELGDQVFQQQHGISSRGAEAVKEQLESALRGQHGSAFDRWLAEHGASRDIAKVQNMPGGVTAAGHIRPEAFLRAMPDTMVANPTTPFAKTMTAAADRMATPSLSENRSLMVRLLSGAPAIGAAATVGGLAGLGSGDVSTGIGAGAGSLGLAAALLGTPGGGRYLTGQNKTAIGKAIQSKATKDALRVLGISALTD